ncbi:hypothetical protein [Streptomyces silvensis]|uniref:Uncharacterized protein n=1 Tax=Streptomyces silvensis TaxID=1765722 RepID=A0A0W7X2A5_9ACTN|nr:hypothetical protein [Streptomyces silvensis]KUF17020.1 hypothetical protein AT728_24290 [Streptomyces silvensis]
MIVVACLLLPLVGLLLYGMDRIEDRLMGGSSPEATAPRHARRRHLRLVRGGHRHAADASSDASVQASTDATVHASSGASVDVSAEAGGDVTTTDRRRAHAQGQGRGQGQDHAHARHRDRRDRRDQREGRRLNTAA